MSFIEIIKEIRGREFFEFRTHPKKIYCTLYHWLLLTIQAEERNKK